MIKRLRINPIILLLISFNFSCFAEITSNSSYKTLKNFLIKPELKKINLLNSDAQSYGQSKVDISKTNTGNFLTELTDKEQKHILLELFSKNGKLKFGKKTLEDYSLQELNILSNSNDDKGYSLYKSIDKTQTAAGSIVLSALLSNPISDITVIKKRQKLLGFLLENEELCEYLNSLIKIVKVDLNSVLNYWNDVASLDQNLKNLVFSRFAFLNKSIAYHDMNDILSGLLLGAAGVLSPWFLVAIIAGPILGIGGLVTGNNNNFAEGACIAMAGFVGLSVGSLLFNYCRVIHKTIFNIHQRLRHVSAFIRGCDEILYTILENEDLSRGISLANAVCDFVTEPQCISRNLHDLRDLLNSSLFEKQKFGIFSNTGTVVAAHHFMDSAKDAFIPPLELIGELDAYLSIVQLIKEYRAKFCNFCFVDFVEQEQPYISLSKAWNISIGSNKAKSININIGRNNQQHMIISGPIESGKSSLIETIAICDVLGRTFGIAPAQKVEMSLFDFQFTCMDSHKNTSIWSNKDKERKINIMNYIKNNPCKKILAVIDEPYNHLTDESADILTYDFLSEIAQSPNVTCIAATKYKKPTDLAAETGKFANCYFDVSETFDNEFELVPGICNWWFNDPVRRLKYVKFLN